jgi:hypothetical protein
MKDRKKILDVVKVGFYGATGDNRSPEDFCLPACMTSLMQYLGEDIGMENNGKHVTRHAYADFLTASGMAFGLLWHPEFCMSCMDLTQVNEHNDTIKNVFNWAGYEYDILEKNTKGDNREDIKTRIIDQINRGIPVIAFGIIGPPECLIICGYDEGGDVLIGWSSFQEEEHCEKEPNGMFCKRDWYDTLWKVVICGRKVGRKTNWKDVLVRGLSVMQKQECSHYLAGSAAYDAWMEYVLNPELSKVDDTTLKSRHQLHHILVGNHAEARYYGHLSLKKFSDEETAKVADVFMNIHDTCWKVWGVLGEYGQEDVWIGFRDAEKRQEIARLLSQIKELDKTAVEHLQSALM